MKNWISAAQRLPARVHCWRVGDMFDIKFRYLLERYELVPIAVEFVSCVAIPLGNINRVAWLLCKFIALLTFELIEKDREN